MLGGEISYVARENIFLMLGDFIFMLGGEISYVARENIFLMLGGEISYEARENILCRACEYKFSRHS